MKSNKLYIFIFGIFVFGGCINAPDFSETPEISFVGFSKSSMLQGDLNTDSITLIIDFTDRGWGYRQQ